MTGTASTIVKCFSSKTVVIIGDLVADQNLNGTIARVSREAPVFILRHDETSTRPGAAANAAANVASLGGRPVLVGVIGNDANGNSLRDAIVAAGIDSELVVSAPHISTTTKVRVLAGQSHAVRQQVIRIDYENHGEFTADLRKEIIRNLTSACENADAIIVSDYNYGVIDVDTFEAARTIAQQKNIPILIDSRFSLNKFSGATAATPNQDEVEQILGKDFTSDDCFRLRDELGYEALLVTNGNKGMELFADGGVSTQIDAVGSPQPVDVTGAGDTVIAAFALGLASGMDLESAARVANHAGGLVVMKKGTATITIEELIASIDTEPLTANTTNA